MGDSSIGRVSGIATRLWCLGARGSGWVAGLKLLIIASVFLAGFLGGRASEARAADGQPIVYPKTRKGDQVDTYHGVEVPDPYRWLEDADSTETEAWVEAQNRLTFGYLGEIATREKIKARLTELWNYERYGLPFKKGGRYFYKKNDGLQNQYVLYTMTALDAEPQVLFDPNKLSKEGTIALSGYAITEDGKYMAYGLSKAGSDWQEWHVREVATGKDLADHLKWIKFSGASWTKDGKGFFYSRYSEPAAGEALRDTNYFQKLFYHRLGAPQSKDVLVYDRPDQKEWGFGGTVTDDGRYLIINVSKGTLRQNQVYYKDLHDEKAKVVELISEFEAQYNFVDNDGPVFWFRTDLDAPRGRLIAIDITKPDRANWRQIIRQRLDTLRRVSAVGGKFVANYLEDAHSAVRIYDLDGTEIRELEFPMVGSASGFYGRRDDPETFYRFESYTRPGTIFRYDVATGQGDIFRQPNVDIPPRQFTTRQYSYRGTDGVEIPIFVAHHKGMKRRKENPTYLYGYGGFNISITPRFSVANMVWMEMGGVFVVANIRGGGEYGRKWHEAGSKLKKQTCFDDFIAAAEWLIEHKYTNPSKLAIGGGSNGGLLVGACMTQRPDLFGACLPNVGVLDMLRFHKFTIGWAWVSDYGSADDPTEFKALFAYSPLHNLKAGTAYPATLILTGDHDDRVVPAHSFKFAAALQAAQSGAAPTLIRIQTQAGHGAGKPTLMRIEEAADKWAFLVRTLNMPTE